ncbi:MAG: exodeoxyribonuclease III [Pseudomonadota bacterium]
MAQSSFKLATWNINSVRLRIGLVERYLREHEPDVLCLQEIKCQNDQFPAKALKALGYEHFAVHGQKGYHGVATISKRPLDAISTTDYVAMGDTRHIECVFETGIGPVRVHNFYVPAGGDEANPVTNPKFDHKMKFIDEMKALSSRSDDIPSILVGDLNIAPLETDVWSHKQLLKVVSHTPVETDGLKEVQAKGSWVDLIRQEIDPAEKIYTWWSYRARDWDAADKGRRLDHIWGDAAVAERLTAIQVLREARGWEKPSDHVPIMATFSL